ncbi:MAG: hypothetical protein ACRDRW_18385 [Pseudonocardiaceae bacterium]
MRRIHISESLAERRSGDTWQYRVLLKGSEIQGLAINLLGLLYHLVDEFEVSGAKPPAIRLKYDTTAQASARIAPNDTHWTIRLSRTELEVWLKFLTTSLVGTPSVDHIDLIDETVERDLQFTLAIAAKIEVTDPAEVRKRLEL